MRIKELLAAAWTRAEAGLKWIASVHSERDGAGSASRICLAVVTTTVCGALVGHLCLRHSLPDAGTLGGLSGLLTAGAAGYGANKITGRGTGSGDDRG